MARYQPPRSGMRSLVVALTVPLVLAAGVYVALDRPDIVVPAAVTPPDTAQRFTKGERFDATPPLPPMPKATPARVSLPSKAAAPRYLGPGVYKCEDSNGAVSYSEFPCGDSKWVDTRPTSGGFADQWSMSVTRR